MLTNWERFKGWAVLEYFLQYPTTAIHVNALARFLKISPLTANTYLTEYFKDGLLEREAKANALFYRLAQSPLINTLKRFRTLLALERIGFVRKIRSENPSTTSIVLYGTHASGTYDEKSDYDILVISQEKTVPKKAVSELDAPISLSVVSLRQWRGMNASFKESVWNNHIVLYGPGLVR